MIKNNKDVKGMMVNFHHVVKDKYLSIAPDLWWGDDLDVRFFLLRHLVKIKNKKILDIGCNVGISISFLDKSNDLYGIDNNEFCVNKARKLNNTAYINKGSMESQPVSLSRKGNEAYVVFGSDDTWEVKGDFTLPSVLFSHLNNGEVQARDYLLSVGSKSGDLYTVDLNKVKETGEKLIDYFI